MAIDRKLLVSASGKVLVDANGRPADPACCCGCDHIVMPPTNFDFSASCSSSGCPALVWPTLLREFGTGTDDGWTIFSANDGMSPGPQDAVNCDTAQTFSPTFAGSVCEARILPCCDTPIEGQSGECSCEFSTFEAGCHLTVRKGTVNGSSGWHLLLWANALVSGSPGCTVPCANVDWFNAYLGTTLQGTVTASVGPFSFTWTVTPA